MKEPKKKSLNHRDRRNAGGSATASGMNFQAAVTAIAASHLLLASSLGWLNGLVEDIPAAIWAETGGPGDDVRIELRSGEVIEAQIKRGLSRGKNLWEAMLALAAGIDLGTIQYGVLIVSPDTSRTIWTQLSADSQRMGEGRTDGLSAIGQEWLDKLTEAGILSSEVCARIRIHVVHASSSDQVSVVVAQTNLKNLFENPDHAELVWLKMYRDAHAIAERRGRWDQVSLTRMLMHLEVQTRVTAAPASVAPRISGWAFDTNRSFSLLGVKSLLSIDEAWLSLKAAVIDIGEENLADPVAALARYHSNPGAGGRNKKTLDAEWIGRFYTRAVVIGGPGMGKSTLMTRLARLYARDGFPVLKVRLRDVAARLVDGNGFDDSVMQLGLDGSGVSLQQARESSLADWVLLCDGLDECGDQQGLVAACIRNFSAGNPRIRIIVTTRIIGYRASELSEWRHYELVAPEVEQGSANLAKLLRVASSKFAEESPDRIVTFSAEQLGYCTAKSTISQSPQLLGIAASLIVRGGSLGSSKADLYQSLFEVIDAEPNIRKIMDDQPDSMVLLRVFDIVGWELISDPIASTSDVLSRSAKQLCMDLDVKFLNAKSIVNVALSFWQQVGLIEPIHYGAKGLIAFVHKSFAEFAAARYMWTIHEAAERTRLLSLCLDDYDRWNEVVAFASAHMGEAILDALLERAIQGNWRAVERALSVLLITPNEVSNDIVRRMMQLAFMQVDADNTVVAYRFGLLLVQMVSRFESIMGDMVRTRLDSSQLWTQRVAWACAVEMALVDIDAAQAKLGQFLERGSRSELKKFTGSLMLRQESENGLHERMALALVRRALDDRSTCRLSDLLVMFANQSFDTVGFNSKLHELATKADMNLPRVRPWPGDGFRAAMMSFGGEKKTQAAIIDVLIEMLASMDVCFGDGASPEIPLQLSGLFEVAGWNQSPASDIWWPVEEIDREPMLEVLRGVIALSAIHPGQLQLEAAKVFAHQKDELVDPDPWFIPHTFEVDIPEPDWSRAGSLELDRAKLEHAALHLPEWLAISATKLLESLESPAPARLAYLLDRATGSGLNIASYLARGQGEAGLKLLLDRLDGQITNGFEYLLEALTKTSATWVQVAPGVERAMYASSSRVAVAATIFIRNLVENGDAVPQSLLDAAYQHWVVNEDPYPTSSGIIPESPRKVLLEVMNHLQSFSDERIFDLLDDPRGDVKDLAISWLIQRSSWSQETRSKLVTSVKERVLNARSVGQLFDSSIVFDVADVSNLITLFSDVDPAYRLAALRLIKPSRMPNAMLASKLKALTADAHAEVSRAARTLWDTFEADGILR